MRFAEFKKILDKRMQDITPEEVVDVFEKMGYEFDSIEKVESIGKDVFNCRSSKQTYYKVGEYNYSIAA